MAGEGEGDGEGGGGAGPPRSDSDEDDNSDEDDDTCDSSSESAKQQFSVTSSESGLRLKIAAIPQEDEAKRSSPKVTLTAAAKKGNYERSMKNSPVESRKSRRISESNAKKKAAQSSSSDSSSSEDDQRRSKAAPKLSATVYSKPNHDSTDSDAPIKPPPNCELVNESRTNHRDVKNVSAVKSARSGGGGVVTRKKTVPKPLEKKTSSGSVVEKSKPAANPVAKRPRGRPRSKLAVNKVTTTSVGEESSCSSQRSGSSQSCSSSDSDSDTDSGALAAACSLQVINEEDLAAILPEHQPCAPFGDFGSCTDGQTQSADTKTIQENGDGSSSEMELPLQLVNAAIQRATADSSSSENESTSQDVNHSSATHYASTLLQQFVTQTQLLSHSNPMPPMANSISLNQTSQNVSCSNKTGVNECVINQSCLLPEINSVNQNFLTNEHLPTNQNQHLSPQQTEELSQINKDLAEITSVTDASSSNSTHSNNGENNFSSSDVKKRDINQSSNIGVLKINSQKSGSTSNDTRRGLESKPTDMKRKRGRPRKVRNEIQEQKLSSSCDNLSDVNNIVVNDFCRNNEPPNVSPDSGILSNHNSPVHSPHRTESDENLLKLSNSKAVNRNNSLKRISRSKSSTRDKIDPKHEDRSLPSELNSKRKGYADFIDRKSSKIENQPPKTEKKKLDKLDIATLDRMLYATDRVLYPPRRKVGRPPQNKLNVKKGPGRPLKNRPLIDSDDSDDDVSSNKELLSNVYAKRKDIDKMVNSLNKKPTKNLSTWRDVQSDNDGVADDPVDPMWREIDLNPKYRDILSGYKSDHEVKSFKVCSRVLESGYKSDYSWKSGYKSDHCCKSGYKSSHKSGYKSDKCGYKSDKCGYKSDYSIRNIRRRMRKLKKSRSARDRSYYKNQKYFVTDQEILLLANKTFSCLTLGHSTSDSDSETQSQKSNAPSKFSTSKNIGPFTSKFTFGQSANTFNRGGFSSINKVDLFSPAPVFGSMNTVPNMSKFNIFNPNNRLGLNVGNKQYLGSSYPTTLSAFTHEFACLPISMARNEAFSVQSSINKDISNINNNTVKASCRNLSPKSKKTSKSSDPIYPVFKKEKSPPPATNIFQQNQSSYVPNKSLCHNVFLHTKKTPKKFQPTAPTQWKKHKTPLVLSPAKPQNIKVAAGRLSRSSTRNIDSKHHRHNLKKHKKHRSRSASRNREMCTKSICSAVDQKFNQEIENLIDQFVSLCNSIQKTSSQQVSKTPSDKPVPENNKSTKRTLKKRKGPDGSETATPSSKRRHKKQSQESQNKGSKEKDTNTNEHKLPLKKRHYHINSSTNNSLSLSLVATEYVENHKTDNPKGTESFVCTESNCLADLESDNTSSINSKSNVKLNNASEKPKKELSVQAKSQETAPMQPNSQENNKCNNSEAIISVNVDESTQNNSIQNISPCSTGTDNELSIKKPAGEHSELSKKIYETSEKLKAIHKMVHDLEKSLPKNKESEQTAKDSKINNSSPMKNENKPVTSALHSISSTSNRNSTPIVTPKKRHRLEADKLGNPNLDSVVQSLSKKLSEEKNSFSEKLGNDPDSKIKITSDNQCENSEDTINNKNIASSDENSTSSESTKNVSKTGSKHSSPTSQKSEIITRKKNRLEGLTSSLVSKINPSSSSKIIDTVAGSNLRKSIESRINERNKCVISDDHIKTSDSLKCHKENLTSRATVIKSPISKLKLPAEAKKLPKGTDILIEEMVVVNVDRPTGIFEPSIDIELQIPKSSISLNQIAIEASPKYSKLLGKPDPKTNGRVSKMSIEGENQIQSFATSFLSTDTKLKRNDSITSILTDRFSESSHNLRPSKRNQTSENDNKALDDSNSIGSDKKKKKIVSNILKESKLKLVSRTQTDKLCKNDFSGNSVNITNFGLKNVENVKISLNLEQSTPLKKRGKRRKANKTGFPSAKRKKKKVNQSISTNDENLSDSNSVYLSDRTFKVNNIFERVPQEGEATDSFLERTCKKQSELKVILNKDDAKQGSVSVIVLERLQDRISENKTSNASISQNICSISEHLQTETLSNHNSAILHSSEKSEALNTVTKWEVLSETDSIPPLSSGSVGNDPEDSIPLSLLNLKAERPNSRMEVRSDRIKRKLRELSPSESLDDVIVSKRSSIGKLSRSKSMILLSGNLNEELRKTTKRNDHCVDGDSDDALPSSRKCKSKFYNKSLRKSICNYNRNLTSKNFQNNADKSRNLGITQGRKSRSSTMKRLRELTPSSRDSSLETVKTIKCSPKSRDTSVETIKHLNDICSESDPLPIQEKEVDFEQSIDVLSKSIINKKRMISSRDDSPASSVERGYRSEKERGFSNIRNPRTRKKYLIAGLFSNYYKENDVKPVDSKVKLAYNPKDYPNGLLPPPPYCERWVRQRKQHFTLPYDIWWQHQYNQPVPSWNYRKIRTNVYFDVKPTPDGCESQACNCQPSSECQDDCINRLVYAECSPQLCPCKESCKNQRIQHHEWSPGLDKFMTENKGWGIRTKLPIVNGTFILEYVGEVVSDKEFKDRMATRYTKDTHHYCLHLDGGLVIDGHRMGGEGRFVNHSCNPNCEMQKWSVNGLFRMALFALRDIEGGEELTYDYNFSLFNPAEGQPCKCDSDNCRGVIGGKSQRIAKVVSKSQLKSIAATPTVSNPIISQVEKTSMSQSNRVGRPRKAVKATIKPSCHINTFLPDKNEAAMFLKEVQSINLSTRFWHEPQMKPLTPKERILVKERHCFLHRNLDKVRRVKERFLTHPVLASGQLVSCVQPHAFQILPNNLLNINNSPAPLHPNATNQPTVNNPSVFLTRLHALRAPRNIKTRRLAQAEDNVELSKQARLANIFRELYNVVVTARDDKNELLSAPLIRKKVQSNNDLSQPSLDLSTIEGNIETGYYKNVSHFDSQFNLFFAGISKNFGRTSPLGIVALQLRKIYNNAKLDFADQLTNILGPDEPLPKGFLQMRKQEEVIMCVCGLHGEEGLMVQCGGEGDQQSNTTSLSPSENDDDKHLNSITSSTQEKDSAPAKSVDTQNTKPMKGCGVWQHARCMQVTDIGEPYYCHRCQPRVVNLEIPLDEYTDEGNQFYLSLLRGDLQVRQGDTVYVLRDIPIDEKHPDCSNQYDTTQTESLPDPRGDSPSSMRKRLDRNKKGRLIPMEKDKNTSKTNKREDGNINKDSSNNNKKETVRKHTYKTIGTINVSELDIFRVERLWKDQHTGQRYVYGHHYLRPHETYHEPTRKFFPNEVMRVPLYEAVPIELVMSQCWVMNLNTYCKGRPLAAKEEHVYICELRVDKCARLFTKISKPKYPICTKSYAFEMFPQKLKITRTYAPHEVSPSLLKNKSRKINISAREGKQCQSKSITINHPALPAPKPKGAPLLHTPIVKNRVTQKARLNGILLKLLSKMPTKQPLDVSYLLDGRRQRKKIVSS